jgi:periplasmic protein TonB
MKADRLPSSLPWPARGSVGALTLAIALSASAHGVALHRLVDRAASSGQPGEAAVELIPIALESFEPPTDSNDATFEAVAGTGTRSRARSAARPTARRLGGPQRGNADTDPGDVAQPSSTTLTAASACSDPAPSDAQTADRSGPAPAGVSANVASAAEGIAGPNVVPAKDDAPRQAGADVSRRLKAVAGRCYPDRAATFQIEGTVRLSFCVDPQGKPVGTRLVRSSGSKLLDDAALDCVVRGAAPFTPPGACFAVPVAFVLR